MIYTYVYTRLHTINTIIQSYNMIEKIVNARIARLIEEDNDILKQVEYK